MEPDDIINDATLQPAYDVGCKIILPTDEDHAPVDWPEYVGLVPPGLMERQKHSRSKAKLNYATRKPKQVKVKLRNHNDVSIPPLVYREQCRNPGSWEEVLFFARGLGLRTGKEWLAFTRLRYLSGPNKGKRIKPDWVPTSPDLVFKNKGWEGWKHFLNVKPRIISYHDFLHWISVTPEITTQDQYNKWYKAHPEITWLPCEPWNYYEEWVSWHVVLKDRRNYRHPDFYSHQYPTHDQFVAKMHKLKITNSHKYQYWRAASNKRREHYPVRPEVWYGSEWKGWPYVVSTTRKHNQSVAPTIGVVHESMARELHMVYRPAGYPSGVVFRKTLIGSIVDMENLVKQTNAECLGIWEGDTGVFTSIYDQSTSEWLGGVEECQSVFNIHELRERLDFHLKKVAG